MQRSTRLSAGKTGKGFCKNRIYHYSGLPDAGSDRNQEVAMIEKPGTLTRLNALFDDDAKTDLLNGEIIERHPDTVVIMTTNMDYIGCQMFNESVLSRMQLVQHRKN